LPSCAAVAFVGIYAHNFPAIYYPTATLINLIVSPTLALTIFLPPLGSFSLIYFLIRAAPEELNTFILSLREYYSFFKTVFISRDVRQCNAVLSAVWSSNALDRNNNKYVRFALVHFIIFYSIIHAVDVCQITIASPVLSTMMWCALRWLNILGSISNRTSWRLYIILQVVTNRCLQDLRAYITGIR